MEWKITFCSNIQKYYLHNLAICHTILAQSTYELDSSVLIFMDELYYFGWVTRAHSSVFFFLFFFRSFVSIFFLFATVCETVTTTKSGFDYEVIRYPFLVIFMGSIFNCTSCLYNFDNYSMIKLSLFQTWITYFFLVISRKHIGREAIKPEKKN